MNHERTVVYNRKLGMRGIHIQDVLMKIKNIEISKKNLGLLHGHMSATHICTLFSYILYIIRLALCHIP